MKQARQWNWYRECPQCGGVARVTHTLGRVRHLRCRECGTRYKRSFRVACRPGPASAPSLVPPLGRTRTLANARLCPAEGCGALGNVYRTAGRLRQFRCPRCGERWELKFRSAKLRPPEDQRG